MPKNIITVSECCLIKMLPCTSFEIYINILVLEMARPGNQHCADCIGTRSFPTVLKRNSGTPKIRVLSSRTFSSSGRRKILPQHADRHKRCSTDDRHYRLSR